MGTIILIRPTFMKTLQLNPPIGLGYLAAFLEKKSHKVILIDCRTNEFSNDDIIKIIKKYKPKIVGLTALTVYYEEMRELCRYIHVKREGFDSKNKFLLIIGGVHVSALPELSLAECKADLAVLGEGEVTLLDLIEKLDKNENYYDIDGIAYFKNGEFKVNKPRELVKDINTIPFPAWHLIPPNKYP
ncbi:MAG: cobalamin B12-binding domain-containing protein, partial [Candidatus Helarchaeota archaeon]|nr:cobalamin B12-binding domain-containing protein [Candidatus Helarchaeota archaeon]